MKKKKALKAAPKKKSKPKKKVVRAKVKPPKRKSKPAKPNKKKTPAKKVRAKKSPKPTVVAPPNSRLLGRVEVYFAKIGVAAFKLEKPVTLGARLHFVGHTTHFEQVLDSMQIDHVTVTSGKPGDAIGIKVTTRVRDGDYVYLILS